MNTFRLLPVLFAFALGAAPGLAQSGAQLTKELKAKEAAAKKDPEQLFEVGKWATEKSLQSDAKRIYQAVLKIKPDHAGANEALGNELVEGKWMPAKEAAELRKKAMAAEYAAKGFVEVSGVWVEKDKADDAKRGIFHHEGELVTKEEMVALQSGKVRHPETGELIDAKYLEKAQNQYYPGGGDRWVDIKGADQHHSDPKRPWYVRTRTATLVSTLSLAKINELKVNADQSIEKVMMLFGGKVPPPALRPVVLVAATDAEFQALGNDVGDGTDACGSFLMEDGATLPIPYVGNVRAGICVNDKDWAPRHVRHCAAMSYVNNLAQDAGIDLPLWFVHGVGSYTSRLFTDSDGGWFGKSLNQKGGLRPLKAFFAGFAINSEQESSENFAVIYQAGLLLHFAAHGGDAKATEALQGVTSLLSGAAKGNADKAFTKLQTVLTESEAGIRDHLQKLIAKAPQ